MHIKSSASLLVAGTAVACLSLVPRMASAAVIFVDNRRGSDLFNGATSTPVDKLVGPVATIQRAINMATSGDAIVIANTGVPYHGPLRLVGARHSGNAGVSFSIAGNGAVVTGTKPIPPSAWKGVGRDLWQLTPWRKAFYQLVLDGKAVPEHPCPAGSPSLPEIPNGHWCAWHGDVYFKAVPYDDPQRKNFELAVEDVGLTLYNVRFVEIRDLAFRHFRIDGINAHDLCRDVSLVNVQSTENGRAGFAVGGSSDVLVVKSELAGNRQHSALITELGVVRLDEAKLSDPPTVLEPVR